jgi:hypothetical protein
LLPGFCHSLYGVAKLNCVLWCRVDFQIPPGRRELPGEELDGAAGELIWLFEGEHVAAVVEDFEFGVGDVLGVELADGGGEEFVLLAPEEEGGAFDAVEVLGEAGVVEVRIPGDAGGGFAGAEPVEDAGVVGGGGHREGDAGVVLVEEEELLELV